jgi:hypothetical protein
MPRQPRWFQQVPGALRALEHFPAPVLDREALEQLLSVGRRDAIRLMHRMGGYQAGRTFLVERETLREMLSTVLAGDAWRWEATRRRRVAGNIAAARREWQARRVVLTPTARTTPQLPRTVRLERGHLEIEFHGTVDLLTQLLQLSQTISADLDRFAAFLDDP